MMHSEQIALFQAGSIQAFTNAGTLQSIRATHPHYRDVPPEYRIPWLTQRLVYANALNHQKADPQMLKVDAAALDKAMVENSRIGDLTQSEIDYAMFHGQMGDYGEYFGLTPKTFMGFFRAFLKTPVKEAATLSENARTVPTGDWVLARMEYHRKQVQAEYDAMIAAEDADKSLGIATEGTQKSKFETLITNQIDTLKNEQK